MHECILRKVTSLFSNIWIQTIMFFLFFGLYDLSPNSIYFFLFIIQVIIDEIILYSTVHSPLMSWTVPFTFVKYLRSYPFPKNTFHTIYLLPDFLIL
ncbi:CRISPR-associated protein Cas5 [Candidatus Poribacteria bacterium]|nr:CRISPR-associated protein Cas5 [Candidatus Poribacteria bacterium]